MNTAVLTRKKLWDELNSRGWPISWTYFQSLCSKGLGPRAVGRFGLHDVYTLESGLEWVHSRTKQKGEVAA
jgi:hypothetical protein